jgi:hypothetical protein
MEEIAADLQKMDSSTTGGGGEGVVAFSSLLRFSRKTKNE